MILTLVFKGTSLYRLSNSIRIFTDFYRKLIFNVKTSFDVNDFCANSFLKCHLTEYYS